MDGIVKESSEGKPFTIQKDAVTKIDFTSLSGTLTVQSH